MHKTFILSTIFTLNTISVSFSQNVSDSTINKNYMLIPLEFNTGIDFDKNSNSFESQMKINNKKYGKVEFYDDGDLKIFMNENNYFVFPESYNIGISIIKDKSNHIVGMSKKYDNKHLIGIDNLIYKIEMINNNNRIYKLTEITENTKNDNLETKKIIIDGGNGKMEIFHNLEKIHVAAIPIMVNTKKINKKIANKAFGTIMLSLGLLAFRLLVL